MTQPIPVSGCVYGIYCPAASVLYIGSAHQLSTRWSHHKAQLQGNRHPSAVLQRAWNRYQETDFEWLILANTLNTSLLRLEAQWVEAAKNIEGLRLLIQGVIYNKGLGRQTDREFSQKVFALKKIIEYYHQQEVMVDDSPNTACYTSL